MMFSFKKFSSNAIAAGVVLVMLQLLALQGYAQGIISGPRYTCPGVTQYYTSSVSGAWSVTGGTMVPGGAPRTVGIIWDANAYEWMIEFEYRPDKWSDPVAIFVYANRLKGGEVWLKFLETSCVSKSGKVVVFNHSGPVLRWERSTDNQNWTHIPYTGVEYTFPGISQNTWFRAVIDGGSCGLYYSSAYLVHYSPVPSKPTVTSARTCAGTPTTLTATGNGYSYQWYEADGVTPIPAATNATYSPPTSMTRNFYVSAKSYEGCESEKALATVTVDQLPAAPPNPDLTQECDRTMVTMKEPPAGQVYRWSYIYPAQTSGTSRTFAVDTSQLVFASTQDTRTGCYSYPYQPMIVNVQVVQKPAAPPAPSLTEQCRKVVLNAQPSPDGIKYFWQTTPEGTSDGHQGTYTAVSSGTYYLRAVLTSFASCWSPATGVPVTVKERLSCIDGQNMNYVVTNNILKEGVRDASSITDLLVNDNGQTVSYLDGFGRSIQEVAVQASPGRHDVVQALTYDNLGRMNKKYLPYSGADAGKYDDAVVANLTTFYDAEHASSLRHASTSAPWSQTVFEASPLNRIKEQGAPGEAWQIGKSTTRTRTFTNQPYEVRLWEYDFAADRCASPGYYAAGALIVEEVTDENGHLTLTFKDKQNKVILIKKALTASEQAQTYFVYDRFSRVRMIVQPEGVKELQLSGSWNPDATFISKWCFTNKYDRFGRLTEKSVPGASPVYFVYNKSGQIILTQDGKQRGANQWAFNKYDALQRKVMSGTYTHPSSVSQAAMQALADAHTGQFERRTPDHYETQRGYTVAESFPAINAGADKIYVVSYYDDYNFDSNATTADPGYMVSGISPEPVVSSHTINKKTGELIAVPGTAQMLLTINFYDKRGNVVQKQQDNHLGGKDVETKFYDFAGKILTSRIFHQTGSATVSVYKRYQYDHAGKLLTEKQRIDNGPEITLASYQYNELGQQVEKSLHSEDGNTYLQKVDQHYHIRGWLSKINDRTLTEPSDLFGMELVYNEPGVLTPVQAQYNGNIAEVIYNDRILNIQRGYGFTYDRSNRLTAASYGARDNNGMSIHNGYYNESGITYDLNGNIRTFSRRTDGQLSHDLSYTYSGNRLITLDNAADAAAPDDPDRDLPRPDDTEESFGAGDTGMQTTVAASAGPGIDYTYDANGNLLGDTNKGITSVEYNHLNLVERIVIKDKGEIHYGYDALGRRLTKTVIDSTGAATTRYYVAGFEYNNDRRLELFSTTEGRVIMGAHAPEYQYFLKDHLGNVRVTFTATPQTQTASATFETTEAGQEKFLHADEAVKINHALFDHTNQGTTRYAARLSGAPGERIGLAKTMAVLTGDVIDMEVFAKYVDTDRNNWNTTLTNFMAALATGTAPAGTVVDGGVPGSIGNHPFPIGTLIDKNASAAGGPKAYLNYLVFDRFYNLKTGGFVRVSENAKETGTDVAHEKLHKKLTITEPGYVYVYLSNESDTPVDVYFDDFTVTHVQSMVVQGNDYYPFGMTFNSFTRENSTPQRYLFNGKERQDELDLGWEDFGARMYDPEIARWNGVDALAEKYLSLSPFAFVDNNPLKYVDKDGKEIWIYLFVEVGPKGEANQYGKVMYKNGNLYTDSKGTKLYSGDNKFATKVKDQLNQLKKDHRFFADRIDVLTNSKEVHTIEFGGHSAGYESIADRNVGIPTGSIVAINPWDDYEQGRQTTELSHVVHELLSHGYDADQGITAMGETEHGVRQREADAVIVENIILEAENKELRTTYGGKPVPDYDQTVEQIQERERQRLLDKKRYHEYIPFEIKP